MFILITNELNDVNASVEVFSELSEVSKIIHNGIELIEVDSNPLKFNYKSDHNDKLYSALLINSNNEYFNTLMCMLSKIDVKIYDSLNILLQYMQ